MNWVLHMPVILAVQQAEAEEFEVLVQHNETKSQKQSERGCRNSSAEECTF